MSPIYHMVRTINRAILVTTLLISWKGLLFGQGEDLFDDSFLHEIHFYHMDTSLLDGSKIYQLADMSIDGNDVDSIGIKEKGNISGNVPHLKVPLKVKTNKYVAGRKYDGIKEFTLHNNYQDPTMLREKLTYEICAKLGLHALRTAFAKVYIDRAYWGLYTLVEGKDEMFKIRFGNRDADAIESLDFGNMCFISDHPDDYNIATTGYPYYKIENGDENTAFSNFAQMIDIANNTPDSDYIDKVSKYLNLEHFFRYQAANVYLMNFDSYIGFNGNQIYLHDTVSNIWEVIPWDFNGSMNLYDNGNGVQYASSYPLFPERIKGGCIAGKLLSIIQLKNYYLEAMCELVQEHADTADIFNRITILTDQIQNAVYSDSRKMYSNQEFDLTTEYGHFSLDYNEFEGLKTFFSDRYKLIKESLKNENFHCDQPGTFVVPEGTLSLTLYPCPSVGMLNIEPGKGIELISVRDIYGRQLIQLEKPSFPLDVSYLKAGTYLISVRTAEGTFNSEFILH